MEAEKVIPYLGCKVYQGCYNSTARAILNIIPPAEHFYDLFGGGGSVSETACEMKSDALLRDLPKWNCIHYNEINTGVCELNKAIWNGTFDFEKAEKTWISRERFFAEKDEPTAWGAFVKCCWSFGCDGNTYIYGQKIEYAKQILHALIVNDNPFTRSGSSREKRLLLRKAIGDLGKNDKIINCEYRTKYFESIENMHRLQSIEMSFKNKNYKNLKIISTNKDYRDVEILPNSVVYCDIPYNNGLNDYGIKFDYPAFYEWALTRNFPVYISEYNMPDSFECVWQKEVQCRRSKKSSKGIYRIEKLFWNGRK